MLNKTLKFEDIITFSRASSATYWDANGVLQTAATDVPRFDHDPATGERLGLLIEGQRTNFVPNSEDPSTWNLREDMAYTGAMEDRGLTFGEFTPSAGGGGTPLIVDGVFINFTPTATGEHHGAVVLKSNGIRKVVVRRITSFSDETFIAGIDLENGTLESVNGSLAGKLTELGDGYYLFQYPFTINTTSVSGYQVSPLDTTDSDGVNSFYAAAYQYELGAFSTSYIPTNGAAATRSADTAAIDPLTPWFAATPNMTLFCDWIPRAVPSTSTRWHMLRLGGSLINGQYGFYNTMNGIARDGDGNLEITNFTYSKGELMKTALLIRDGVVFFGVDGVLEESYVSGNNAVNSTFLVLGGGATVAGHLQDVLFYPHALSDEEVLEGIS